MLPKLLNKGGELIDTGVSDITGAPLVRREWVVGHETYVAVFEVRRGRQMLALQTLYVRARRQK